MPFVLVGVVVLLAAGGVALYMQRSDSKPGAGPAPGTTTRQPDPPSAPTTGFQTTSSAELPSSTVVDDRANENPDKWNSSNAATAAPVGANTPEDPFIMMAAIPAGDVALGYAVDDLSDVSHASPFEDDIERRADLAYAPASFQGGLTTESLK